MRKSRQFVRKSFRVLALGLAGVLASTSAAQMSDHPQSQELTVAAEIGFAPFNMKKPGGSVEGFMVDMNGQIAKRLGRPG